jgi:hypothetical protein
MRLGWAMDRREGLEVVACPSGSIGTENIGNAGDFQSSGYTRTTTVRCIADRP